MKSLRSLLDAFRGAGDAAVTIPSMDGSLRPNSLLDRADVVFAANGDQIACLASVGPRCLFSCGRDLLELGGDTGSSARRLAQCDGLISALAVHPSGRVALGLSGKGLLIGSKDGELASPSAEGATFNCPVGLVFEDVDSLIVANGSTRNAPEQWRRDLMEKNRSGSVWRVDLKNGKAERLAKDLAYPHGVAVGASGDIVVSESWRHRLLLLGPEGQRPVLDDLPGYPGSIARGRNGGYWLAVFAPRRQLVEFVLREDGYRKQMLATLDERHWVAPALKTGLDYFEPVQSGGVRHLGIVKPWAPSRSYGLIVRLDDEFNPRSSYHSRADANRHGITGVAEWGDRVLVACAATNQLLAVDPNLTED